MFVVEMTGAYGEDFTGYGETIEDAVNDAEGKAGDDLVLARVIQGVEIQVKKITEYKILDKFAEM